MDFSTLLSPVAASSPAGEDLSFSDEFDAIQEMRRADDPSLDQGEWVTELKVADWPGVAKACEDLLATRTKDLRVAGWLVDAWSRLRGFGGMHDGLALTSSLVDQHWSSIHPLPDDGDQEQRAGSLTWLVHRIEGLVRQIPLATSSAAGFSLADLEAARHSFTAPAAAPAFAAPGAQAKPGQSGPQGLSAMQRAVSSAGLMAFERQKASMDGCLQELARLQTMADAALGDAAPAFGPARRALELARDAWVRLARDSGITLQAQGTMGIDALDRGEATAPAADGWPTASLPSASGALSSRAQALQQLRQVADYFRRTEPHSPVAYLADKAAQWGDMPLHAWLREVVKDGAALAQLEELLGTSPPVAPSP